MDIPSVFQHYAQWNDKYKVGSFAIKPPIFVQPDSAVARLHRAYLQKYCTWVATFEPMCKCVRLGLRGKHTNLTNSYTCFNRWPDFGTEWPGPNHRWLSPTGNSREEGGLGSSNTYCGFWNWDNIPTFRINIQGYTATRQTLCRHQVVVWCLDKSGPDRGYKTGQLHCCCSQSPWNGCKKLCDIDVPANSTGSVCGLFPLCFMGTVRVPTGTRDKLSNQSQTTPELWASAYMTQASNYTCWDVSVRRF